MSIFAVVSRRNNVEKGLFYTEDFYQAQLVLHQVAVEYAREQHARAVEEATVSSIKTEFIKQLNKDLYYVQDVVNVKEKLYQKNVYRIDIVQNGFFRECYRCDAPVVDAVFQLVVVEPWYRSYFDFFEWINNHSVSVFTNGNEDERRKSIIACLSKSSVELDWPEQDDTTVVEPISADSQVEEKPEPERDEGGPLYIVLSENADKWKEFCHHVEPYSDVAIERIMEEQERYLEEGENVDDVVVIIEASTHNLLRNSKVLELCENSWDLNMSVILSIPMNNNVHMKKSILEHIHYFFHIHPNTENAFNVSQQGHNLYEECDVYEKDKEVYGVEKVAWLEYDD